MQLEEYKKAIEDNFLEFKVNKIEKAGEGFDSFAFEVNDEYIFRFPKWDYVSDNLAKEICVLPKLSKQVDIAIPNFLFKGKWGKQNWHFVGYKKIIGHQLLQDLLFSLPLPQQEKLIKEIAHFIKQVHGFSVSEAKGCGVEEEKILDKYEKLLKKAEKHLFFLLDSNTQNFIMQLFETFISDEKNLIYAPTFIHADLSPDHILFDRNSEKISGVIDFGDLRISDPDYDLIYFYEDYSDEFLSKFLKYYSHDDHNRLLIKLRFFRKANWIYDMLFHLEHNNQDGFNWALEGFMKYVQS